MTAPLVTAPLATALLAATSLPDPGALSIVSTSAGVGAFLGGLNGRVRRLPPEQIARATADGAFIGGGCGAVAYLIAVVTTYAL